MAKPTYKQLEELVAKQAKHIEKLEARIADLESRLRKNSKNSSKPPSSDQKANQLPAKRKEARPFHKGVSRQLLPENRITSRERRAVEECPHCHSEMKLTGESISWQQIEMPEIRPLVHQIDRMETQCPRCNLRTLPELSPQEALLLGPRLESFVHLALGRYRQSHRTVREFLSTLLPGVDLSQGLISKIKRRGTRAFEGLHDQIRDRVLESRYPIHIDPTSWRHMGRNENVVVVRTGDLICFEMAAHQNANEISAILGSNRIDHLVSDRGLSTSKIEKGLHQYCLAHLLRNIRGYAEHRAATLEESRSLGQIYDLVQELFSDHHRLDRGELAESTWRSYGYQTWLSIQDEIEDWLASPPSPRLNRFYRGLLKAVPNFRVYLRNRDHPMTNNPAEEALRPLVIARKLCFGSRSSYGRSWRASVQSCVETLHRQGRSIWDLLTQAVQADRQGCPAPAL